MKIRGFSRTAGYRHASIPAAVAAVAELSAAAGHEFVHSEDASDLEHLAGTAAVVFLLPSGDVLTPAARAELHSFVAAGGGFAGVHAAADAEQSWPEYERLVGARFLSHPHEQELAAEITVEDATHPATSGLPSPWPWVEEWYAFTSNPRGSVDVLLSVDEGQYLPAGQTAMGPDHPLSWSGRYGSGRTWYTALGHHESAYSDPRFRTHLWGGIASVLKA